VRQFKYQPGAASVRSASATGTAYLAPSGDPIGAPLPYQEFLFGPNLTPSPALAADMQVDTSISPPRHELFSSATVHRNVTDVLTD
jgi:hypothetical protein